MLSERVSEESRFIDVAQFRPARPLDLEMPVGGGGWRMLKTWIERLHLRDELKALEPHMLRDIGLTADDIKREIPRPHWTE